MVLRQASQRPVPLRDHFTRWIPATPGWAWAWRLEQTVFGKRKPVNIFAQVIEFAEPASLSLSDLVESPPSFPETNGVAVWMLNTERCKRLGERLKQSPGTTVVCQPRISTADGIDSKVFQGTSMTLNGTSRPVGLTLACFARVHRDVTDLIACFNYSQAELSPADSLNTASYSKGVSVVTNLDVAMRLQVPRGSGFFLLESRSVNRGQKRVGVLVEPL